MTDPLATQFRVLFEGESWGIHWLTRGKGKWKLKRWGEAGWDLHLGHLVICRYGTLYL